MMLVLITCLIIHAHSQILDELQNHIKFFVVVHNLKTVYERTLSKKEIVDADIVDLWIVFERFEKKAYPYFTKGDVRKYHDEKRAMIENISRRMTNLDFLLFMFFGYNYGNEEFNNRRCVLLRNRVRLVINNI